MLGKEDELFKFSGVPHLVLVFLLLTLSREIQTGNVEFLDNKIGKITAGAYLLPITEIKNSVK